MVDDPFRIGIEGEEQEEDVCRVCRLEADEFNPMVHPCKCSGSVRYVHPDCLKSWLAMSQKKQCEICGHQYEFTKVYPPNLPSIIPPTVYFRQIERYIGRTLKHIYRCWLVILVWLVVLPMANMGGLRTFGWFADFAIAGLVPRDASERLVNMTAVENVTIQELVGNATSSLLPSPSPPRLHDNATIFQSGPLKLLERAVRFCFNLTRSAAEYDLSTPLAPLPPPPLPTPQLRSHLTGASFDAPTPYFIFQGQMLSIGLAAVIVSLIFLREWYSSYNWANHEKPTPPKDERIIPEEWVIRNGIAERRFTKIPSGKLIPLNAKVVRQMRREAEDDRRDASIKMLNDAAKLEDWETDSGGEGGDEDGDAEDVESVRDERVTDPVDAVPVLPGRADSVPPPGHIEPGLSQGGPGPSTLAARRTAAGSGTIDPEASIDVRYRQGVIWFETLLDQAEALRSSRARAELAKGLDAAAWRAPELLRDAAEGSATGAMVQELPPAPNGIEEDSASGDPEQQPVPDTIVVSTSDVTADPSVQPATPAPTSPSSPLEAKPSLSPAEMLAFVRSMPTDNPLTYLLQLVEAASSDNQDRHTAASQDMSVIASRPTTGATEFDLTEMTNINLRLDTILADGDKISEMMAKVDTLIKSYKDLSDEIREILSNLIAGGDKAGSAEAKGTQGKKAEEGDRLSVPAAYPEGATELPLPNAVASISGPTDEISVPSPGDTAVPPSPDAAVGRTGHPQPLFQPAAPMPWEVYGGEDNLSGDVSADKVPGAETLADLADGAASDRSHEEAGQSQQAPSGSALIGGASAAAPRESEDAPLPKSTGLVASLDVELNDQQDLAQYMAHKNRHVHARASTDHERHRGAMAAEAAPEQIAAELWEDEEWRQEARAAEAAKEREAVEIWQEAAGDVHEEVEDGDTVAGDEDIVALDQAEEDEDAEDNAVEEVEEVMFEDEEGGAWAPDDWDQILEVVGLVGPYSALIQNLILAIAIMGATMSTFVLFPMTAGKMLLCIDPIRSILGIAKLGWSIARTFLRWSRYLTDPIVDIVVEIMRDVVLKPLGGAFLAAEKILARVLGLEGRYSSAGGLDLAGMLGKAKNSVGIGTVSEPIVRAPRILSIAIPDLITSRLTLIPSTLDIPLEIKSETILDGLASVGNKAYKAYDAYRSFAIRTATSGTIGDGIACLVLAYAVVLGLVVTVAWLGEKGHIQASDEWKKGLRRFRLSVKLIMFLALELVAFPLGAGALMALCSMPLVPYTSVLEKIKETREIALGVAFMTWLVGTIFMYGFAQVLAWCRSYCRPGALYFIRDPHDPKYSPVKEIIDRSAGAQFRKLGLSTLMYSFLVWWLFGAVPWGIKWLVPNGILPLRRDGFGPLSPIPFDYIFLLVALPHTIHSIRPQRTLKKFLGVYWRYSTRLLRLDRLLLNSSDGRDWTQPAKPGRVESIIWNALDIPFRLLFGSYQSDATFARVPAQDRVVLLSVKVRGSTRREGMFIPLDDRRQPKTEHDKLKMIRQDLLSRKADRNPVMDFKVVFLPEKWRTRVHVFILSMLAGGGATMGLATLGPIVLGREILKGRFGQVHDGYSFLVGAYTIYAAILAGRRTYVITVALGRARERRLATRQTKLKRYFMARMRKAIAIFAIYLVHPILRGMVWELRVGLFMRYGLSFAAPVVHIWDVWALGAILNSIELGACGLFGRIRGEEAHEVHQLWSDPFEHNLRHIALILRAEFASLAIDISLPFVFTYSLTLLLAGREPMAMAMPKQRFMMAEFRVAGIVTWFAKFCCLRIPTMPAQWRKWRQAVIDAEYVVEERVENYEPPMDAEKEVSDDKVAGAEKAEAEDRQADAAQAAQVAVPDATAAVADDAEIEHAPSLLGEPSEGEAAPAGVERAEKPDGNVQDDGVIQDGSEPAHEVVGAQPEAAGLGAIEAEPMAVVEDEDDGAEWESDSEPGDD